VEYEEKQEDLKDVVRFASLMTRARRRIDTCYSSRVIQGLQNSVEAADSYAKMEHAPPPPPPITKDNDILDASMDDDPDSHVSCDSSNLCNDL
jgi:hypothetical protein